MAGRSASTLSINGEPLLNLQGTYGSIDGEEHTMGTRVRKFCFSCVIVANAAMGAGMLSFPFGFKVAGWGLGVILILVFAMIQSFSLSVIARSSRNYSAPSYEDLIGQMFGPGAKTLLMCAITTFLFAVCIAYLTVISAQATHILNEHYPPPANGPLSFFDEVIAPCSGGRAGAGSCWIMAIMPAILFPLCTVSNIAVLGPFSSLAVCAVLYTSAVIAAHGFQDALPRNLDHGALAPQAFSFTPAAFQAIPIICFGMFCHFTIVPSTAALRPYWPSQNSAGKTSMRAVGSVCAIVMAICVLVYTPVGLLGYFTFGAHTMGDILDNYGPKVAGCEPWCLKDDSTVQGAFISVAFTMSMSYPIFTYLARQAICGLLGLPIPAPTPTRLLMAVAWCMSTAGAAVLVTKAGIDLSFIVSVLGCTACTLVQFHFPARMCAQLGWHKSAFFFHSLFFVILVVGLTVTIGSKVCSADSSSAGSSAGSAAVLMADEEASSFCTMLSG